jgi:hypothetical protein
MLLRRDGDWVIAIGQASHAWVSGQMARAWHPRLEPYEEICLAAEQHDVGMAMWDLAPALNPRTGLPQSFVEMDLGVHLGLWHAAPARLLSQSRFAALLLSLHGTKLYSLRDLAAMPVAEAEQIRDYLGTQRVFQHELAGELGIGAERLGELQELMFTLDGLSLAVLAPWDPFEIAGITVRGLTLDPWPFEPAELPVRCEGRRLHGTFEDEQTLHAALERAERVDLELVLRPA